MSATAMPDQEVFDTQMNAVIIYDKFDLAADANALLERTAQRPGATLRWSVRPWRMDMLELAEAPALAEALEAHLIIVAVRQVRCVLPWLLPWLERWARGRKIQAAALALWGGDSETTLPPATRELTQFAGQHGLSLLFGDTPSTPGSSLMVAAERPEPGGSSTLARWPNAVVPKRGHNRN